MNRICIHLLWLLSAGFLLLTACAAEEGETISPWDDHQAGEDTSGSPDAGWDAGGYPDLTADVGDVAESEERYQFQAPRASRSYVFITNTTLNTVVKIDSVSLAVTPIEVCYDPTEVRALPVNDRAVVLCRGDDLAAVIEAGPTSDEVSTTWVAQDANQIILSPLGDYALAWYDEQLARPGERPGNPHDLTLIRLGEVGDTPRSYLLSVGFAIRSIQFDAAGETAFVTTDDGLNVVDLSAIRRDQFLPLLSLGDDPLARAADREVLVTDDGRLAFVRSEQFAGVRVLEIESGRLTDVALPAVPTDLDLSSGGQLAVAVLREISTVAVLPLPDALTDPDQILLFPVVSEVIGLAQLLGGGTQAMLYSTAYPSSHVTVMDLEDGEYQTYEMRKTVDGVIVSPTEDRAIVMHEAEPGQPVPGEPVSDYIAKSDGYSLFDLTYRVIRLVTSDTEPDDVVFTEDGSMAFVMLADAASGVKQVQWVQFSSMRVDTLELMRLPEAIGVVPASGRVFVSQLADTGRITFIDTATGQQHHVTAYQLNRRTE
ncbi:MAG: hypothetical protein JW797_10385 [Bradymonadales bacterium]|nr:hypothetical protein [Bradymonadales bacterium]